MDPIELSQKEIIRELLQLDANMRDGPDGLKSYAHSSTSSYHHYVVSSIYLALRPLHMDWRLMITSPTVKEGDSDCASSYSHVSLSAAVWKVLERLFKDKLVEYL